MAHSTLAAFSTSLFANYFDRQIARIDRMVTTAMANAELSDCDFIESSFGTCQGGFACTEKATIHDTETEQEFCPRHFTRVASCFRREI